MGREADLCGRESVSPDPESRRQRAVADHAPDATPTRQEGGTAGPMDGRSLGVCPRSPQTVRMTITLITGANKGLGFETARRLIQLGHTVIIGARNAQLGQEAADQLGARCVQLDVTDDASVARAARDIEEHEGRLDVLINNAGISGSHREAAQLTGTEAAEVFGTNVVGIVRVTHAFLPLLQRAEHPVVVNVSSGLGSFAITHDRTRIEGQVTAPLYTASKAAVTMLTTQYARALPGVRFNAVDPGYTATDLNGNSGPQTLAEGTEAIVTLATEDAGAGTGRFIDRFGPLAW